MKLLLVNPRFPESFWSFRWAVDSVLPDKRTVNPPLGLATLAALSPDDWEIEIADENVESIPLDPEADIVGICGMGVQFERQAELLAYYRRKGYYVVAGGSFASLCPERYGEIADTVVAGEAEYIWKEFCRDFEAGHPRDFYQETGVVSLHDSPTPRFDLLRIDKYTNVSLQFSRGCPFRCEFCDIIVMFGRKPRTKSREQIGRELDVLRGLGARNVFFVDDNFIGNKNVAKDLLRYLVEYQDEHDYAFHFGTEASLNLAQDQELLDLMPKANFEWVFIGIESPDEKSLEETKKMQNTAEDILTSVHRIYEHGLGIYAGFIVGFDNDTLDTFDRQYEFIVESGIQVAMVGLLTALPRTPLYERLESEGRLRTDAEGTDNTSLGTNVIPKQMPYAAMVSHYRKLYERLLRPRTIADRIVNKIRHLRRPCYRSAFSAVGSVGVLSRFVWRGVIRGGPAILYHFLRSLAPATPRQIPMIIGDWIAGLSMRDYVHRRFALRLEAEANAVQAYVDAMRRRLAVYLQRGLVEIALDRTRSAIPSLSLHLKGWLDVAAFARVTKDLERTLRKTRATVTLQIGNIHQEQLEQVNHLLRRIRRYGDRVYIRAGDRLGALVDLDLSPFHLVLEPPR